MAGNHFVVVYFNYQLRLKLAIRHRHEDFQSRKYGFSVVLRLLTIFNIVIFIN